MLAGARGKGNAVGLGFCSLAVMGPLGKCVRGFREWVDKPLRVCYVEFGTNSCWSLCLLSDKMCIAIKEVLCVCVCCLTSTKVAGISYSKTCCLHVCSLLQSPKFANNTVQTTVGLCNSAVLDIGIRVQPQHNANASKACLSPKSIQARTLHNHNLVSKQALH